MAASEDIRKAQTVNKTIFFEAKNKAITLFLKLNQGYLLKLILDSLGMYSSD